MASIRKATLLLAIAGFLASAALAAEVVPQDAAFQAQAAERYARILGQLRSAARLDDDSEFLARVHRISDRLVAVAPRVQPAAANWQWEVHTTSDPAVAAFCIAGGKVLVGSGFVRRLDLNDGELAMLVAHEMAHALAGHRRESPPSGGMESDAAQENRQAALAMAQENEADRVGIAIARSAGWRAEDLVGFYDKLAGQEPAGTFSSTHPSASLRAAQAREWSQEPLPLRGP